MNASRQNEVSAVAIGELTAPVFREGIFRVTAIVSPGVPDVTSAEEQIFTSLSEVSTDIKSHLALIRELKARRGNDGTRAVQPPLEIREQ